MKSKTHWRYERKFYEPNRMHDEVRVDILFHPAVFKPIHHKRWVYSEYFDTPQFRSYNESIDGLQKRKKIRRRWYENPKESFIEVKEKNGLLNKKYRIEEKNIPHQMEKVLRVGYQREYFLSQDTKYRITVDSNVRFEAKNNDFRLPGYVMELKYDQRHDDSSHTISSSFNSRVQKNSKYVIGMQQIYGLRD